LPFLPNISPFSNIKTHAFLQESLLLDNELPSPNSYRTADGMPGPDYWQQKVDYNIECSLNTTEQRLDGKETITYHNQSPNTLRFLWLQLDENEHAPDNPKHRFDGSSIRPNMSERALKGLEPWRELDKFGCKVEAVTDVAGKPLEHMINKQITWSVRLAFVKTIKTY